MTRKHFVGLADALRSVLFMPPGFVSFTPEQRDAVITEIAAYCKGENPNFDRDRFVAYINGECGKNGGKVKV